MKRKVLAMLLACAMIAPASSFSVMAEEETEAVSSEASEEISELNWSDFESQIEEAGWEGEFYLVADSGLMMWIPTTALSVMDITEEDAEAGYVLYLANEDESCIALVQDLSGEEITLDAYSEGLTENGATNVSGGTINGLNALSFEYTDADTFGVAIETEDENIIVFSFYPASDEEYAAVAAVMAASVQTYDEEAESAAEEEVTEEATEAE